MQTTIWIVEDESAIADVLIYVLRSEGFDVEWFNCGYPLLEALKKKQPDLILLDVGLPDISGFELSKKIIQESNTPFVFLTARSEELDRIIGLEIGADDYIVKPFSPREVSVRIRTILRRIKRDEPETIKTVGAFELNELTATIFFHKTPLILTRYEYLLLKTLINAPNRVFSRDQLMDIVWQDEESLERTVDTHIKTIRAKLKNIEQTQDPIQTHRGLGYSLSVRR